MTIQAPVLTLGRADWPGHPLFPQQTLLLSGHASFRRTSRSLVASVREGRGATSLLWVFRSWKASMHSHERYEEHKLYPYLEARWGVSMESAKVGHELLAERERAVVLAATEQRTTGEGSPLDHALSTHDEVLCAHLDLEEELVIPALLALTPAEFEDYCHSDIRGLLQRLGAD